MSQQVNLGGQQPQVNLNANMPQAQGAEPRAGLPQELQNARPSTSVWAKIGRVASYIARGIFAVGTLGISEAAIWGVKKLYNYCHASPEPPQPRVARQEVPLPNAEPQADIDNRAIYNGIVRFRLPQAYKDAISDLLQELSGSFGNLVPKNLDELTKLAIVKSNGGIDHFPLMLRNKVIDSTEAVTPGRLKEMARQILLPELTRKSIANALKPVAGDLGMNASKEARQAAACEMFDKTGGVIFQNQAQATEFVAAHRNIAAPALKKAALLDGLEKRQLPPAYKAQLDSVANELRLAFGAKCVPKEQADILQMKVTIGNHLLSQLQQAIKEKPLSPQEFGKLVRDFLKPLAQRFAMGQAIAREMEKKGVKPNPGLLPKLVDSLIESGGQKMSAAVNGLSNTAGTQNILAQPATQQFLTETVANMKALEAEYLPQVSDDAKPLLRNIIRSLPYDAANRGSSIRMVQHMAKEMAGWKADIPMGAESTQKFCAKMVTEINRRLSVLAPEDSRFNGNIYSSFTADSSRNNWTFNGKVLNYMPHEHLEGELTRNVPTAIDQQFLSKLTNQYAWTDLGSPLDGVWSQSGDDSANEINGSGLAKAKPLANNFRQQPQNFAGMEKIAGSPAFTITVAPDKKTAVVEIIRPYVICTDEQSKGQPVGTANLVMRVECKLSGGDPNVRPEVTNVQVSQKLTPLTF